MGLQSPSRQGVFRPGFAHTYPVPGSPVAGVVMWPRAMMLGLCDGQQERAGMKPRMRPRAMPCSPQVQTGAEEWQK